MATLIDDLPDEVLEYTLSLLSPYRDYKNAMLVCQRWHNIMRGVKVQEFEHFREAVAEGGLWWTPHPPAPGPTITERYSHSACYLDKCLYVFGGCTSNNTAFNDLWKLDLGTGEWIRPLAMGSYPSPKAYASLVSHRDRLVLFGGWSHPTPLSLHQMARFFQQLHTYTPETNNWEEIVTISSPQGLAGHGATVIGDVMVVFGGCTNNGVSCNEIWVLDLLDYDWTVRNPAGNKPLPRYGHAQIQIDSTHILVVGGCGGPNKQFTDTWLLSMDEVWRWDEVTVMHPENCAPQIWCHPACKVGDKMVVLSKIPRAPGAPTTPSSLPQFRDPPTSITGADYKTVINRRTDETTPSPQGHCFCCQEVTMDKMSIRSKRSHPETSESSSQDSSSDNDDCSSHRFTSGRGGRGHRSLSGGGSGRKPSSSSSFGVSTSGRACMGPPVRHKVLQCQPSTSQSGLFRNPAKQPESVSESSDVLGQVAKIVPSTSAEIQPASSYVLHSVEDVPLPDGSQAVAESVPMPAERAGVLPKPTVADVESTQTDRGLMSPPPQPASPSRTPGVSPSGSRSGPPSVRPNAMKNRQKQLEMLKRYEERIKGQKAKDSNISHNATSCCHGSGGPCKLLFPVQKRVQHPMYVHCLDLSEVVVTKRASWQPLTEYGVENAPEETLFYSLVEGRGELIMFGGIQTDINNMRRPMHSGHVVSNMVFFINPKKVLR